MAEQSDFRHYHHRPDEMISSHFHFDLGLGRAPNYQEVRNIIYALRESSQELEGLSSIPFLFPTGRVFLTEESAEELLQQIDDISTAYEPTEFLYHSSLGRSDTRAVSFNRPLPRLDVPTSDSLSERREQNSRNATINTIMLGFLLVRLSGWLADKCRSRRPRRREAIPPNARPPMDPDDTGDENKSNTENQRDTLPQAAHPRSTTTETGLFQQREEDASETEQQDENNDRQSLLDDGMRHRHRCH